MFTWECSRHTLLVSLQYAHVDASWLKYIYRENIIIFSKFGHQHYISVFKTFD